MVNPDALEQAHLLFLRGEMSEAREILRLYLMANPEDGSAVALRDQIERESVVQVIEAQGPNQWPHDLPMPREHALACLLGGITVVALAVSWAIEPIRLGFARGFGSEASIPLASYGSFRGRTPIHLLLMFPTILAISGVALAWYGYRKLRD